MIQKNYYLNYRYNLPVTMIICLLLISLNCVSSLTLTGHSNIGDGQSIGDYTYTGLSSDDLSSSDPSSRSSSSSSSTSIGGSGLITANGNNLDSSKDWIELKNLLTDLERQRALSVSNHKYRQMLSKDDSSEKILLDRLGSRPKFILNGKRNVGQICLPGTGCEYLDMGREAEAKEFLNPSSSTNPGRKRRRRSSPSSKLFRF